MMMTLFDDEQILKAYTKDMVDSAVKKTAKETEKKTERKTAIETAERMIKLGKLSLEEIAICVPLLSLEELKKLETEMKELA